MGEGGSPGVDAATARRSATILTAIRAGYAYNWFDIGPALLGIGATFHVGPASWGLLVAVFLVGAGLLQVPAGLLARRFGARRLSLAGAGILAIAAIGSAFAPTFGTLVAARLVAGVGTGLFFSPAIGLVASLFPAGRRGVPVGAFSSAFSAGSAAGIVVTAVLAPTVGWRGAIAFGGVLLAALTLVGEYTIPPERPPPDRARPLLGGLETLRRPAVWAIGLAFVGCEGASFATGQFIVPWGEHIRGWSAGLAGVVGMMFVLPSVVGGPVGGLVAERRFDHRRQLVAVTVAGAAALVLLPIAGVAGAILIGTTFSFGYGFAYAVMYVIPHYWAGLDAADIPLAIGLFNALQLGGGAAVTVLFGWIVASRSYPVAWVLLGVLQVATLVALVALPATDPGRRPPVAVSGAPPAAPAR